MLKQDTGDVKFMEQATTNLLNAHSMSIDFIVEILKSQRQTFRLTEPEYDIWQMQFCESLNKVQLCIGNYFLL